VVQTVAVARAIRAVLPAAEIGWVVNGSFAGLLQEMPSEPAPARPLPFLTRVHRFERDKMRGAVGAIRGRKQLAELVKEMRSAQYTTAIDLQGLLRSAWLGRSARAKERFGFSDAREFGTIFYNRKVTPPVGAIHAVDRSFSLSAAATGIAADKLIAAADTRLGTTDAERAEARRVLGEAGSSSDAPVILAPGARWASKQWPEANWAALADQLAAELGQPCVLVGSPDEALLCERIAATAVSKPINLAGRTNLRTLAALLDFAALAVTNDSGPMHMAAAQHTPLVALFGPTDPRLTGPWRRPDCVIRPDDAPADPRAYRRIRDDSVMRAIPVSRVLGSALETLKRGRGRTLE
jgi:heptosyltransferase-1